MINSLWHTGVELVAPVISLFPYGCRTHNNYDACSAFVAGGTRKRECFALASVLASAVGISWTRLSDLSRLYGSGQLGHRYCRRLTLRLHTAFRHHALESDGDSAAEPFTQTWSGNGA
jgi:hypothetical protein